MESHSSNSAVNNWYNVPAIQRKEYDRNARIARNEAEHERKFPKKGEFVKVAEDK